MNLCNLNNVNPDGGDYLVLTQYPGEGISVHSQHALLRIALGAVLFEASTTSRKAIVKLVRIDPSEVNREIDKEINAHLRSQGFTLPDGAIQ